MAYGPGTPEEDRIAHAAMLCEQGTGGGIHHSNLAFYLSGNPTIDGTFNQQDKIQLVQRLLSEGANGNENAYKAFYAQEVSRSAGDIREMPFLNEDRRLIGETLGMMTQKNLVSGDQLMKIVDGGLNPNDRMMLMKTLELGASPGHPNTAVETLATRLWQRNQGDDRAAAAMGFASDPELREKYLNNPHSPLKQNPSDKPDKQAFEALVKFGDKDVPSGDIYRNATSYRDDALRAAGTIFSAHPRPLIDDYTGMHGLHSETQMLSRFLARTSLDPDIKNIPLDEKNNKGPTLGNAVSQAYDQTSIDVLRDAAKAKAGAPQDDLMRQYAAQAAAIDVGVDMAMTRYDKKIEANAKSRDEFVGGVSKLVGMIPDVGHVPGLDEGTKRIAGKLFDHLSPDPARPNQAAAKIAEDVYNDRIRLRTPSQGVDPVLPKSLPDNVRSHMQSIFHGNDAYNQNNGDRQSEVNPGRHHHASASSFTDTPTKVAGDSRSAVPTLSPTASNDDKFAFLAASLKNADGPQMDKAMAAVANAGNLGTQAAASINQREQQAQAALDTTQQQAALVRT